ncbi:hypothetical protein ABT224_11215 [Streptomyces sp. NPDC001584]|uniref:hypothetical protein n=1 Tax=Streptomyces sp. NPDC001584 TaxID=3154521 RepID=UPI003323FFA4
MAEGKQKLETKHIQGQVITHTIVKPTGGEDAVKPPEDVHAPAESDETSTASQ